MKHTAEPWRVDADKNCEEFFWIAVDSETEIAMISDGRIDDAKRIVACVNACTGIPTETLEKYYGDQGGIDAALEEASLRDHVNAVQQRNDLAEAIRLTLDENGHLADGDVCTLKRLKDALAKVGAGETVIDGHNVVRVERHPRRQLALMAGER